MTLMLAPALPADRRSAFSGLAERLFGLMLTGGLCAILAFASLEHDGTFERWKYDASGNVASFRNRRANTQTWAGAQAGAVGGPWGAAAGALVGGIAGTIAGENYVNFFNGW